MAKEYWEEDFSADELLALHEALCFAANNRDFFNAFLKRNRKPAEKRVLDAIEFSFSGAELIGKVFAKKYNMDKKK